MQWRPGTRTPRGPAASRDGVSHRRLLTAVAFALLVVAVAPAASQAATMEVQIHIKGRGTVTGPDRFSCSNEDPNPANVKDCPSKFYDAPDPFDHPVATFTATTDDSGWRFSQWSDLHFTSCTTIVNNRCTIEGRQNSLVVRPATVDFTRDAAPPSTISAATATDHSASFAYAESEGVSAIACTLENPQGTVVASGCDNAGHRQSTYDGLASGLYRFRFRVTDFFGHVGDATADVAVLQTSIASGPPAFDANASPRFSFAAPGAGGFKCSISGGVLGVQDCGSPFTTPALRPDGQYTLSVYAVNGSFSDPSPATWTWYVDTTPPSATIKQPAEGAVLSTAAATLALDATDNISSAANLRYECRLDDNQGAFAPCSNPYTTPALRTGVHSLDVRAVDQAGNRSAPVRRTWRVDFPDADGDGHHSDVDCDDADPAINPGATEILDNAVDENCDGVIGINLDRDGDRVQRPADCNDNNAAIHPGAVDLPRNGVDEDCSGGDADYPRINSPVLNHWQPVPRKGTKVLGLSVNQIPAGAAVQVRCAGRGCAFRSYQPTIKAGRANATRAFKRRRLARGTIVEVRVTAPGMIGKLVRFTVRSGAKLPTATPLCLVPGASQPASCG